MKMSQKVKHVLKKVSLHWEIYTVKFVLKDRPLL